MPVVVTFRGNDYAFHSTAQKIRDEARLSLRISAGVHEHNGQAVLFGHLPYPQGELGIKWVSQVADDEADGVRSTADPEVTGGVVSQVTKLLYRSADAALCIVSDPGVIVEYPRNRHHAHARPCCHVAHGRYGPGGPRL